VDYHRKYYHQWAITSKLQPIADAEFNNHSLSLVRFKPVNGGTQPGRASDRYLLGNTAVLLPNQELCGMNEAGLEYCFAQLKSAGL
jgi:hypothetical protein